MKNFFYFLSAVSLVGFGLACSQKLATATTATSNDITTPTGKKKFIDAANMNTTVRPQDDFYEYANGTWLKNVPIPASESSWGSFLELRDFNQSALKNICEETAANPGAKGSLNQKVGDLYASGMDTIAIDKAGLSILKAELDRVNGVKNYTDLIAEIGYEYANASGSIFGFGGSPDSKNNEAFVVSIGAGGINLPDRDLYLNSDERSKKIRTTYESHILNGFKLVGETEAKAKAAVLDIMKMETAYAKSRLTRVESRDPNKTYNKMTINDLEKVCPQMNWAPFMAKILKGTPVDYVIVRQPNFLKEVNNQLKNGQLEEWKNYLKWNLIKGAMPYLGKTFVEENFRMNQAFTGQKVMQPRWKTISSVVDGSLGEALGQVYTAKHFKPEAKARMVELVGNLMKVYEKRITNLEWMSDATKKRALEKLSTFVKKIGYPDKWKDYATLNIDRSKSFLENMEAVGQYGFEENIKRIGKPVDKSLWFMSPPTVNAYYSPINNEIVFPAGILQFPFFDNDADDAFNYGGIGAVIGHEISHGFDDQGKKYDYKGNLADWWTEDDTKKFTQRTDMVVDQYNNFKVLDTMRVNGKLTLGENIADLGGLAVAYEAFKTYSPQAKTTQKIDGFTSEQRFFLSWAQIWRAKYRDEAQAQQIMTDPHSPGKFRCNGPLTNMPEFYGVFGVKEGDKMHRPSKIRIW
jgi:putative endopeptidase